MGHYHNFEREQGIKIEENSGEDQRLIRVGVTRISHLGERRHRKKCRCSDQMNLTGMG